VWKLRIRLHPVLLLSFFIAPTLAERLVDGDVGDKATRFRGPGDVKIGKECCDFKGF